MRPVRRAESERGYALIFVFALSATMALLLYMELPRLALEMQRNREGMLIERGEQYARAIQVFTRANKRYPQTIEELENYNGKRFLRRRYSDPLTGKDEWRLIHADASGRLTDSLVQKQKLPGETEEKASTNTFTSAGAAFGSGAEAAGGGKPAQALVRRASEMEGAPGQAPPPGQSTGQGPPDGTTPPPPPNGQFGVPGQPGYAGMPGQPPQPGGLIGPNGMPIQRIPGVPGQMGQAGAFPQQGTQQQGGTNPQQQQSGGYSFGSGYGSTGSTATTGNTPQPQQPFPAPQFPGQMQQQYNNMPGSGSNSFGGANTASFTQGTPGTPGGPNPAARMIQDMLTRPNPRGLQNLQAVSGQTLGGGIAGVASKVDAEGIKVYNEKTNYKEWEFVYDPAKEKKGQLGQTGMPGANPANGLGQPIGIGQPGQTMPNSPGFGGSTGGMFPQGRK